MAMTALAIGPVAASTINVCPSGCSFSQIGPALAAANSGDTITIGAGTYNGGFTIDINVKLIGAGADVTIIRGGGPVVTIGISGAPNEPTVSITGVTITGGDNTSSPFPFLTRGGGLDIPPSAAGPGATVTINNSLITGNRADPSAATDSGIPCPPDITISCINGNLPVAIARGGGIATAGPLTLSNTVISDNVAGSSVSSDAEGAGIFGRPESSITLSASIVSGNEARAVAPNGRFADAGAIFAYGGLTVANSVIRDNRASLAASMPSDVASGAVATAGGIHVADSASATIRNTTIADNTVVMTNSVGDAIARSGGVHSDVDFTLNNDVITGNRVRAVTLPGSSGNAWGDSGVGEISGAVSNARLTSNSVTAVSASGDATAIGGTFVFQSPTSALAPSLTNSVVSGNELHAFSSGGAATVAGGGLVLAVDDPITLRNTTVSDNSGTAKGLTGSANGGGILDVDESSNGFFPGGPLDLLNSSVTGNQLSGGPGINVQGGGLYMAYPLTRMNSTIKDNVPDNCTGLSC
jgi:hypothetical protein